MTSQAQGNVLPELSIIFDGIETDLSIGGNEMHPPAQANKIAISRGEDWLLSSLKGVVAESDNNSLVDNLVKQTCEIAGFGPMVAALEKFRA